jgi:hypothetical protein
MTEDAVLSFSPISVKSDIPILASFTPMHQIIWPAFFDSSGNVMYKDTSGNDLVYKEVTDSFGNTKRFQDVDSKIFFTVLSPIVDNAVANIPNSQKAIIGPLLPVSGIYEGNGLQLDGHCSNGSYGFSKRLANSVCEPKNQNIKAPIFEVIQKETDKKNISISISIA